MRGSDSNTCFFFCRNDAAEVLFACCGEVVRENAKAAESATGSVLIQYLTYASFPTALGSSDYHMI